jgi:hypothetical protein
VKEKEIDQNKRSGERSGQRMEDGDVQEKEV